MFALIKSVASLVAVGLLLALSKPVIPSENTPRPFDYCRYQSRCAFGGDGGIETPSRTPLVVSLQPLILFIQLELLQLS